MARLPTLQNALDSYDSPVTGYNQTPRGGARPRSRLDELEGRLQQQERTTSQLLDRAYRIKEDVLVSFSMTHGTWQEEKQQRALLQEHIRTITEVVRKLNRDIMMLEADLRMRQGATTGATDAVKNLEITQAATITDLRGRVARCDVAIAKLSVDTKGSTDALRVLSLQLQENYTKIMDRLNSFESKLNDQTLKLERNSSESSMRIQSVEGGSSQQLTLLDSKTRALIEETRHSVTAVKQQGDGEREKMEIRLLSRIDRLHAAADGRVDRLEKRIDEALSVLSKRAAKSEEELASERERSIAAEQAVENRLQHTLDNSIRRQGDELHRLKKECRDGFGTVHETVTQMNEVVDGRMKLLDDQLRKEISQIRKTLVLI